MGPFSISPLPYVELVQLSAYLCFSNARYTLINQLRVGNCNVEEKTAEELH